MLGPLNFSYQYKDQERLSKIDDQSAEPGPDFNYSDTARGQATTRSLRRSPLVTEYFTMTWDSAHRMLTSNNLSTGANESYRYDAHGHRVRSQSGSGTRWQIYSQSGDLMFEKHSVSGKVNKYAYLGGRMIGEIEDGQYHALHTDNVGSLRMKSNATSLVIMEDIRAPYGSVLLGGSYHNGPAYAGHVEDQTSGLTYMKARYYDPVAMRFMSPDPVDVSGANGGGVNRYWYANNNPYRFIDPDGRFGIASAAAGAGAVILIAYRAYSAYDTVTTGAGNVSTLADDDASTNEKIVAGSELAGSALGGKVGRQLGGAVAKAVEKIKKTYFSRSKRVEAHRNADGNCEYCGKPTQTDKPFQQDSAEGDHFIPQSKGGATTDDQLINACRASNGTGGKGDKMPGSEWQPPAPNERVQEKLKDL